MSKTSQRKVSQRDRNNKIYAAAMNLRNFPFPTASSGEMRLFERVKRKAILEKDSEKENETV